MSLNNLVRISPTNRLCPSTSALESQAYKATIDKYSYNRQQLLAIKDMVKLDTKYCRIPFRTINLVRKLKINRRPSKLDLQSQPISQTRINTKKLVNIDISPKKHTTTNKLKLATINTRSIKKQG